MAKKSYEESVAPFLEEGYVESPFDALPLGVTGTVLKKHDLRKDTIIYKVFPFVDGESVGIRLDWEISVIATQEPDFKEEKMFEHMAAQLIWDVLDIVKNVSDKMTNGDIFHPVIPAEAYDE